MTTGAAQAQSLRNADEPAEFPPSSYTGKQYVDSRGCVYVRAGFDGAVTWVPRVNRQRKVICNANPTFARAPKPKPEPAPVVVAETPAAPAPEPRRAAPVVTAKPAPARTTAPAPRRVVAAPKPAPVRIAKPMPTQVVTAKPRPMPSAPVRVPTANVGTACPGASALSQQYMSSSRAVRCGPQSAHPNSYATASAGGVAAPAGVIRVPAAPEIKPPPGFKAAFTDGRFNPHRGKQTREGFIQMRLIWTAGTPRRLVDQNTGRDVTGQFPELRFPFVDVTQQKRYVAIHGWPASSEETDAGAGVTVSTKNSPIATVATPPSGHRFVQVGAFTTQSKVDASIRRLQGLGLPVRLGSYKRSGKTYRVVMAGPFGSAGQLQAALSQARGAGFPSAKTRK
ncbi:SPOR domain-containing protein [Candidatus Rhodobacter oscarellae]|nr:SPOR domain-containing protein [Candidatus Rhodobacter lobularis]